MKHRLAGSTDVTEYFNLELAADGTPATGLTITDLDMQYVRSGSAPSAKVDAVALAATDSAHTDNRGIEIDATDQPGLYRFDWPDAAFASGVGEVVLTIKGATIRPSHLRVNLTPVPSDVRQIGGSATAATNAANGWAGLVSHAGTAQAGAAGTITLASGASSTDDYYNSAAVSIVSGTGAGQTRKITDYTGSTRVATVDTNWVTNPDNTSVYQVLGRIV